LSVLAGPVAASVRETFLLALLHPAVASSAIPARPTNTDCEDVRFAMELLLLSFCYTAAGRPLFQTPKNQVHELVDNQLFCDGKILGS
jgi:hypothetical protein